MVISCPECSTRFRVDESKIPERGAKIRCARCKHIFAVSAPTPEVETPVEEPTSFEEPATTEEPAASNDDFGFDDFESPEIGAGANDELDPSAFDDEVDSDNDEAFSFGDDYGNVSLGDEPEDSGTEEPFSFGDPVPEVTAPEPDTEQEQFSFSPAPETEPGSELPDPLADSFQEDPALNDISMPPSEDEFNLGTSEPPETPQPSQPSSRSSFSTLLLILLVIILAVIVAGGVLVWKNGPAGIEQLFSKLSAQTSATAIKGDIRLTNLQGSFITNRKEGELFVIQGAAINDLNEAQAAIQVKGIIYNKSGKQLMQKTIFCGNPISDNDLRKMSFSKMEEMMGNQFGESLANLNVTSGQSIPFTIVFRKLPKTLSEFVVEVADSKPAAQ